MYLDPATAAVQFRVDAPIQAKLYLTAGHKIDAQQAVLYFNTAITQTQPEAIQARISPTGTAVFESFIGDTAIQLRFSGVQLGAMPVTVTLSGVVSKSGQSLTTGSGDRYTFGVDENEMRIQPNPLRKHSTATLLNVPVGARLSLLSGAGYVLKHLPFANMTAKGQEVQFELQDSLGNALQAGVYFIRVYGEGYDTLLKFAVTD
jgi:hypothetical protein